MRVLVTGASGMIGTHLCSALEKAGHEVAGLSRSTSSRRTRPDRYYLVDILDRYALNKAFNDFRPEVIFHLAAQAYNSASYDFEDTTYLTNIQGSRNVFDAWRDMAPDARMIPACSSAEYGLSAGPFVQESVTLRPITPYGVTKATMEMMCRQYALNYKLDCVLPRLFIHVGTGHPPATAIQNFAMQIAKINKGLIPNVLYCGDTSTERDFVDVRDGVNALILLAGSGVSGDVYNICTGSLWSIGYILGKLINIGGSDVQVKKSLDLKRLSDEQTLSGSPKKMQDLGWRAFIDIDQTLEDVYNDWLERV